MNLKVRKYIALIAVAATTAGVVLVAVQGSVPGPTPVFRQDLEPFGYVVKQDGWTVNHFDLNFLGEDLLLVSANVRAFTQSSEPLFAESRGNLLLFDVVRKLVIRRAQQTLASDSDVVRATRDGQFVALGLSGLRLCSTDLRCGPPLATEGPIQVSPDGRMVVAGGNGQSERQVVDSSTLTEVARFPWKEAVEASGTVLLLDGSEVMRPGESEKRFVSLNAGAQFLSGDLIVEFTEREHEPKKLVTHRLDGTVKFETVLESSWYETKLIPATNAKRFCIDEIGYNKFSLPNLLGYGGGSVQYHFERVRVLDTDAGKQLFELRWDPRPYVGYMVKPAISPDGHRLAIERHGFVEVFEIP